eukprot:10711873-Alexandrium_andersonii.AAC.1
MREWALLAAEAAEVVNDERVELDDAGFVNFDLKGGLGPQSQEGWRASVGGTRQDTGSGAGPGGAGSELSGGSSPTLAGREFRDDVT